MVKKNTRIHSFFLYIAWVLIAMVLRNGEKKTQIGSPRPGAITAVTEGTPSVRYIHMYHKKNKIHYTAVRLKISSKPMFAGCVWYSDRGQYWVCVLLKDASGHIYLTKKYNPNRRTRHTYSFGACQTWVKPVQVPCLVHSCSQNESYFVPAFSGT